MKNRGLDGREVRGRFVNSSALLAAAGLLCAACGIGQSGVQNLGPAPVIVAPASAPKPRCSEAPHALAWGIPPGNVIAAALQRRASQASPTAWHNGKYGQVVCTPTAIDQSFASVNGISQLCFVEEVNMASQSGAKAEEFALCPETPQVATTKH